MDDPKDFTRGNIFSKLLKFMLPILGALILQTMYSAADVLIVGQFGTSEGISAISTGSSVINLVIFVLCGLAMGVTIVMGRYIGEEKKDRLGRVIGGAIVTFTAIAVVIALLLLLFAPLWADLMQSPPEAHAKAVEYIRICGGGIFFIIGYNLISSIFRGIGNSTLPLIFVAIACVINIFGDLLFVAVFHMDVAGAAIATVLAQACSLIMSLLICRKIELPFTIRKEDLRFGPEVRMFVLSGLPMAFQELLTQISFLALLAFINGMGTTEAIRLASSSGYGVANKLVGVVMLVPSALMQSMSAFIAQNVGAGKEKRAQRAMGYGMLMGGTIGLFMTAAAFFGGQQLAALFTQHLDYQLKAAEYLQGYALEAIVTSILFSYIGYFSGHNKTFFVMLQGLAQSFIVRLPMAYIMTKVFPDNMLYVGFCAPSATIFGILINTCYFLVYTRQMQLDED
ncbi:MAG: MATE family efflux transporter [Lachnospiraceae bacterium]|nr:MATE family efflux transporter [Lachnospiraceae bacterium]